MSAKSRTFLIVVFGLLIFVSCGIYRSGYWPLPRPTSVPTLTPTPSFKHFDSTWIFPFEFDYPASWDLETHLSAVPMVYARDPSRPTPEPEYIDVRGEFRLFRYGDVPDMTLEEYISQHVQELEGPYGVEFKLQELSQIDGIPAMRLVYIIRSGEDKGWMGEDWMLFVNGYVYFVRLGMYESERNGSFGQAFDEVISTMRIEK